LDVTLRCQSKHTSGSGKSRTTNTSTLWENTVSLTAVSDGVSTALPFRMDLPGDQPASSPKGDNPSFTWQARVKVKHFGFNHTLTFNIPVRPCAPENKPAPVPLPHPNDDLSLAPLLQSNRVKLTRGLDSFEVVFKPAGWFWIFLPLLPLLPMTRGIRCDRAKCVFTFWWKLGPFGGKEFAIGFSDIARFDTATAMETNGTPTHYYVQLHTRYGKTHGCAKIIKGLQPAQSLARFLSAQLAPPT
jgi:hypothetical protein